MNDALQAKEYELSQREQTIEQQQNDIKKREVIIHACRQKISTLKKDTTVDAKEHTPPQSSRNQPQRSL